VWSSWRCLRFSATLLPECSIACGLLMAELQLAHWTVELLQDAAGSRHSVVLLDAAPAHERCAIQPRPGGCDTIAQ
jgi:hypothetical protein